MDIKLKVGVTGGWLEYTLSPGCTVSRTLTKDFRVIQIPGEQAKICNLGRVDSDIIRVDGKASYNNCATETGIPAVSVFTIAANVIQSSVNTYSDYFVWGSIEHEGRIKNISFTQRPGEGDLIDYSITFQIGTATATTG